MQARAKRNVYTPLRVIYNWLDNPESWEPVTYHHEIFDYGYVEDWDEYRDMLRAGRRWLSDLLQEWDTEDRLDCEVLRKTSDVAMPEYIALCHDRKTGREFLIEFDVDIIGEPAINEAGGYFEIELLSSRPRECRDGCKGILPYYSSF